MNVAAPPVDKAGWAGQDQRQKLGDGVFSTCARSRGQPEAVMWTQRSSAEDAV